MSTTTCIGAGASALQSRDLRAIRAVGEEDDGVHGDRMKPLASLSTATTASLAVSRRRKPLEPLVRCRSLPAERSEVSNAKENVFPGMETRGIKRKAAQEDSTREAKVPSMGNEKTRMDLLFMALDSCSRREDGESSDKTVDEAREWRDGEPSIEAVKKWKQLCRLRSSLKRAAEGKKTEQEGERSEVFKPGIMSRVRDGEEVRATIGAVVGSVDCKQNTAHPSIGTVVDPPKQEACSSEDPSLSAAAVNVAARWLDLLHLDLKGRLAALKRSRRRVRGVIVSSQYRRGVQGPGHRNDDDKWMRMFMTMDAKLAAEGSQLEASLKKVQEMQKFCEPIGPDSEDGRVFHIPQPGTSSVFSVQINRERARAAAAASICSTANFAFKDGRNCEWLKGTLTD